MTGKRIHNLLKLGILIGIRQGYFLLRHLYKIFYEPEIEIQKIFDDFDKSQILLLALTTLTPILFYLAFRVIWDLIKYGNIAAVFGGGLNLVLFIEGIIFAYLGYFVVKVLLKK